MSKSELFRKTVQRTGSPPVLVDPYQGVVFFLDSPTRNSWLEVGPFQVYFRKSSRIIAGGTRDTLDIANVLRDDPNKGGKGELWMMIEELKSLLLRRIPGRCLYFENVLNDQLRESLINKGWIPVEGTNPPSYYKELT